MKITALKTFVVLSIKKIATTISMCRIVLAFIWIVITILGITPGGLVAQTSIYHDGSFTDSTGRTILYGYWIKDNWDTTQPRGLLIFFHGNSTGTADDMRRSERGIITDVLGLGLVAVSVASPRSSKPGSQEQFLFGHDINSYGTRVWLEEDNRLIHELLQSGFNSTLAVDYDQIIFAGVSQGTCFLAKFIERYAGIYGGGFHAWCGCFWGESYDFTPRRYGVWMPSFQWTPFASSFVKSRFRVFVEATTEDFLHSHGVAMAKYYSELLGLDTRWDLDAPGAHCGRGTTPLMDILKWLSSTPVPERPRDETDADGDGIPNAVDPDDDNDGALDFIDALPLDPRDWLDTDEDGIGNFADRDADGDGVENALDPFSLDPREWLDTDEDGIGNTLDADDDNDGLRDTIDPNPLQGVKNDQLVLRMPARGVRYVYSSGEYPAAFMHSGKPASVVYPEPQGDHQFYQFINLGDSVNPRFEIMIDRFNRKESCEATLLPSLCNPKTPNFAYFEHYIDKIYIDRNHNQNLTDDGPALIQAHNNGDYFGPGVITVLEVPYASGDTFPYGIFLSTAKISEGVRYKGASTWMGYLKPPFGERVLVGIVDANLDGIFNSKEPPDDFYNGHTQEIQDFACIDLDRNGVLNECDETYDDSEGRVNPVYPGKSFKLDSCQYTISVAPSGHQITWLTEQTIPQTLTKVSGDEQKGVPGTLLETPLIVEVRDINGNVLECTQVTFAITDGDGTLSVETTMTDSRGRASSTLTLSNGPGTNTVSVTVAGLEPVTFTAAALATPDFDGDGTVGVPDFLQFVEQFGLSQSDAGYDARFDLDGDGIIGIGDFLIFVEDFGKTVSSN